MFKFLKKNPKQLFTDSSSFEGKVNGSPIQKVAPGEEVDIGLHHMSFNCYTGTMFTLIKNCKSCMMEHSDEELCNLFKKTAKTVKITRKEKQLIAQAMMSREDEANYDNVTALSAVLTQRQLYRILLDATLIYKCNTKTAAELGKAVCKKRLEEIASGEIDGYVDAISNSLAYGVSEDLVRPAGWNDETQKKRKSFFGRVKSGHTCEALIPNCLGNAVLGISISGDQIEMTKDDFMRFTREFSISCDGFILDKGNIHLSGDEVVDRCDHDNGECQFDQLPDTIYVGYNEENERMVISDKL